MPRGGFLFGPGALAPPAIALALFASAPARAQGNYGAVPTGGRSALMGNTGVVLARDGSAPFLNPATIAAITDLRVALSVNAFSLNTTTLDGFHAPGGSNIGISRESISDSRLEPLPSTFCFFLTLGAGATEEDAKRRKLAMCAGTTQRRDFSGGGSASGTAPDGRRSLHLGSVARTFSRVHVGPTYAVTLSDRLDIGVSLHLVNTRVTSLTTANAATFPTDAQSGQNATSSSFTATSSGTSFDAAALIGATYDLDRITTLGIAFAPPSVHVGGELDASDESTRTGGGDFARTRAASGRFSSPSPMRIAVGLGTRGRRVRFEVDATYFFPTSEAFRSDVDVRTVTARGGAYTDRTDAVTTTTDTTGVVDGAIGAEVFVTESFSVLGGVATDFGAVRKLPAAPLVGNVVTQREDRVIATLGVGTYGTDTELLVGAQLGLARGSMLVADSFAMPADLAAVSTSTTTLLLVVAGSTNLSHIRKTLDHFRGRTPGR